MRGCITSKGEGLANQCRPTRPRKKIGLGTKCRLQSCIYSIKHTHTHTKITNWNNNNTETETVIINKTIVLSTVFKLAVTGNRWSAVVFSSVLCEPSLYASSHVSSREGSRESSHAVWWYQQAAGTRGRVVSKLMMIGMIQTKIYITTPLL